MSVNAALPLYHCDAVRQLDSATINHHDIPGIVLMKRAGLACLRALAEQWPKTNKVLIFCGSGNNGGDGYILAGLAKDKGLDVRVIALADPLKLKGDAARAYQFAVQANVDVQLFSENLSLDVTEGLVVVDALLGIGFKTPLKPAYLEAIEWMNRQLCSVLSVDIPSGLNGDTGSVCELSVRADVTVTFIGRKLGLFTGQGPSVSGQVIYEDLGVPTQVHDEVRPLAKAVHLQASAYMEPRARSAFKNQFGHVMVVGGDLGTGGAAMLSAEASARCGAGLVSLTTQPAHVSAALARLPELMVLGVPSGQELEPHLDKPSVIAIGPGLGSSPWSEQLLQLVLKKVDAGIPAVIDADALNLIARRKLALPSSGGNWVLTPHSGEAARLLSSESRTWRSSDVEADRPAAIKAIQQKYGGVVILKGAGSLVYDGESLFVITDGNPGMATGGCGDVLTGVIAALLAQGLSPANAALLGASLHAQAGDTAAQSGERGLMAGDLIAPLRSLVNV